MLPYRKATRALNVILACSLLLLVWLFLHRPLSGRVGEGRDKSLWIRHANHFDSPPYDVQLVGNEDSKGIVAEKKNEGLDALSGEGREVKGWRDESKDRARMDAKGSLSGAQIVHSVSYLNENFAVLNTERWGGVERAKTVIVIQVHDRLEYLRLLVDTLSKTAGIEDALLVFSHDINIPDIDALVRNITFARVVQMFYPYNMQLFPHVFPGQGESDCAEKIGKEKARAAGCRNWEWPDKYGNYRVAKFTQIKHHWWWKMNYVFDGLINRYGLWDRWVLLLEEDHYVAPDALRVLDNITANKATFCAECEIISLGFYLKTYSSYGTNIASLGVHPWFSSKHNMGMALRADTWASIKNCSHLFCTWDDYNWDWSLLQISVKCMPKRFKVIFAKSPRVLHVGDCGVHTHRCAVDDAAKKAADLFHQHEHLLFPRELKVTDVSHRMLKPSKENGGWGDKRDRSLCALNTHPMQRPSLSDPQFEVLHDLLGSTVIMPEKNQTLFR